MKKIVSLLLAAIMLLTVAPILAKEADEMPTVLNLQTEYLTNPLGLDEKCPRFSWNIASVKRGVMQEAYQIVVTKNDGAVVWDTGKVSSDISNNIEYKGLPLESKTKYTWAVKVWDNFGNESDYSEKASFETAFLDGEWEAEWISCGDTTYPKVQIILDNPVSARYIRLNASKLGERVDGWGESGYRLQLAEFEIYSTEGENVALGKAVTSPQVFTNATWSPNYTVDGILSSAGTTQGYTSQMYTSVDTNVTVTVDLGAVYDIDKVVLYPRNDAQSINPPYVPSFPENYKIEYSVNNSSFESAYSAENAPIPQFKESTGLPIFGKSFNTDSDKEIASARAYASGLGLFEMHINGQKVTDAVLEPGETNFDKKAFYVTYDITDKITNGENAVGVYMGKGFYYNPSSDSTRYNRSPKIWGPLMFVSQIEITYTDGTRDIVVTDETWKHTRGPVIESVWLGGEDYDANCEIENFATASCDMSAWDTCEIVPEADYPFERLEAKSYNSIKAVDTVAVESITEIANSDGTKSYTVKFERNFAGVYTFKASYDKGTKITFKPAEHVNSDGTVNQGSTIMWGSSGSIYDTYTFRGEGVEEYTPKFVYHGFQYLQIDGSDMPVTEDMLTGFVYRCDNKVAGSISASDENVTKVHQMITNSISDNMFNVITDCPHREKLGWLEVSHLLYPSIANNFNVAAYMEKISDDMIDAQKESGSIPSIVPPLTVGKSEHALRDNSDDDTPNDPTWCGAHIMVPWYTYITYGDTRQLEKAYDSMAMYFAYLTSLAEKSGTPYILESGDLNRDLGDWMSIESTDVTFVVTCTYYQLADTMAQICEVLDKDTTYYSETAENIKNAINEKYFDTLNASYGTSQTANALPLYLGIVPQGYEKSVAANIAENVESNSYHLTAGEVGLKTVFNMLSEYGYADYAYKMIMNETSPSYYYFVANGKTTLPEIWDGGASQDHCMAGHGEGWLYEYLGGIRNDSVAYKNIIIAPHIAEELTHFEASVDTTYGKVVSQWSKDNEVLTMNVTIPANTTAKVYFEAKDASKVKGNGVVLAEVDGVKSVYSEDEKIVAEVGSGNYTFTMPVVERVVQSEIEQKLSVMAQGGSNPEYATDGDASTYFIIGNQSENEYENQYIQFELNGKDAVSRVVIKKTEISLGGNTTYWGDHSYAVGCVLEGSFDGESWETFYTMPKNADGMDGKSEVVITLEEPKAYKYIRYIRKENNSYVTWADNNGNKLIMADIEIYALKQSEWVISSVEKNGTDIDITLDGYGELNGSLIVACYGENQCLTKVSLLKAKEEQAEYSAPVSNDTKTVKIMLVDLEEIEPLCKAKEIIWEE